MVQNLHKPTTRYMCTLLWSYTPGECFCAMCAKSCSRRSCSAGSRSPQRLICTKSSMDGISVIKTRWSLSTEVVNSSFYCTTQARVFLDSEAAYSFITERLAQQLGLPRRRDNSLIARIAGVNATRTRGAVNFKVSHVHGRGKKIHVPQAFSR